MRYQLNNTTKISMILGMLQLHLGYKGDYEIDEVSQGNQARRGCLAFCTSLNAAGLDPEALYVGLDGLELPNVLTSANPRLDFIRILTLLESKVGFEHFNNDSQIHPTVSLGENVVIDRGVMIDEGSSVGHNVVIHAGSRIGRNCVVGPSTTIGTEGFGYERDDQGVPHKFVHLGGVSIGDNVEIGSLTSIARGTLSDTVIESNVKIDNLIHIAHNCFIKEGAMLAACAELSGGVVVGKNAWIAPNACVKEKVIIGNYSLVGLGAVVTRDVPDRSVVAGNPARLLNKG